MTHLLLINDPTLDMTPSEMSLEELVELRENINHRLEDLKASLSVFSDEILLRLKQDKLQGTVVGDRAISMVRRVSFDVTLTQAKELGAVKEAIDQDVLKKLDKAGVSIPNKKVSEYIRVSEVKRDAESDTP